MAVVEETTKATLVRMDATERATIDVQVATAHKYPRSVMNSIDNAITLVTRNKEIARKCQYTAPWNKSIQGPSIRLAEALASAWGNIRVSERIVEEGAVRAIVEAYAHDLESNVAMASTVTVALLDKSGNRHKDYVVTNLIQAAMSKARRNAILKTIPRAFAEEVLDAANEYALGGAKSLTERYKAALGVFKEKGVSEKEVLAYLERERAGDVTHADISVLLGVYTAIDEGESTIDEVFRPQKVEVKPASKTLDDVADSINAKEPSDG